MAGPRFNWLRALHAVLPAAAPVCTPTHGAHGPRFLHILPSPQEMVAEVRVVKLWLLKEPPNFMGCEQAPSPTPR